MLTDECMSRRCCGIVAVLVLLSYPLCGAAVAEDWPTYNHDNARSAVVKESLRLPLYEKWQFELRPGPDPAWPGPARQDYWHRLSGLHGAVTYDRAFHVAVAAGGVYFGSSADGTVCCLDADSGELRWRFFTEGPVRLAPSVMDGRVYAGSDDGVVYCLDCDDGELLWRMRAVEEDYRLPGNGHVMSLWPVRTGVLTADETAYFCAGLFPMQGAYLCAVDARTGVLLWKEKIDISPQGYMLAASNRLFVPTGRTHPVMFDRSNGHRIGDVSSPGGTFALVSEDVLVSGPGRGEGAIGLSDSSGRQSIATFDGLRMVCAGDMAYIQSQNDIQALNRKRYLGYVRQIKTADARRKEIEKKLKGLNGEGQNQLIDELNRELAGIKARTAELNRQARACFVWKKPSRYSHSMIMAGGLLLVGGQDTVAALHAADGRQVWTVPVRGKALGLAVAGGRLYVSTDSGMIHCFGNVQADIHRHRHVVDTTFFENGPAARTSADTAGLIVEKTGIRQGYCLVLDSGDGRLAYQLAKRTDLKIICPGRFRGTLPRCFGWPDRQAG